ncbi:hypothetical protein UK23_42585 [Lentzea aerocolonigenes]|uniref:Uncharacterized protein n=1 Tax=Lentzea aerocolonigenes TaxID=68170 RepID=A0A0F0GDD7_LENAE|nr:hypothetical protein UK23_42585 [Lentzea aerocolonigenes]
MNTRFDEADYQLLWPRVLFIQESSRLLNKRALDDWNERCELLLEDAFVGGMSGGPLSEFQELADEHPWSKESQKTVPPRLTAKQKFLRDLMQNAALLREDGSHRKPYWSQRKSGTGAEVARLGVIVRGFVELVEDLERKGYFEKRFGKDCVDSYDGVDASSVIERAIGVGDLWPLKADLLISDLDLFCDVVEVLHDLVARPTDRSFHSYSGCGWHHSDFAIEAGRTVYRWQVNKLLAQGDLGLLLAEEGEDIGRMVTATADARHELVDALVKSADETGDQIRHAVALFRARGADRHQKRSAVFTLARILEGRRDLLQNKLLRKDEGALFMIANQFDLRHQNEAQKSDYDEAFLDWVFWWYLATIELTDRLASRDD